MVGSQTKTANFTLTAGDAGVLVMSAANGVLTGTLPLASASPGTQFIFRTTSPSAHVLTASVGDGNVFVENRSNPAGNVTGSDGTKLVMPAIVGSSVVLLCDAVNWVVLGGSGTFTLSR